MMFFCRCLKQAITNSEIAKVLLKFVLSSISDQFNANGSKRLNFQNISIKSCHPLPIFHNSSEADKKV
ncbi:CLUMA_CG017505, isoform A [Clunio marinus]|uniref:CLUMA_CG017505, isoform A n=1 Tax=Clunio marinus TaxID=568069 RepID=A0A1J1IVW8_9DIPT|nr:CLUMA_CG017505, isoform A [Clunio marinus]